MKRIYLSSPHMGGNELKYIHEAFEENWVAPLGKNVDQFEIEMQEYLDANNTLALSSGTAAIHLALKLSDVREGDYVFCSTFTFSASCNPILYEKAIPVFIDSDESWNMSPKALKKALEWADNIKKLPKAIIIVDLYGESADWDEIIPLCEKYGVTIIEDAAEALGCTYKGKHCGTFGEYGIISFNGNKIITTSGGGMLITKSSDDRKRALKWSTQSRENALHYEHKEIGYNYRMSNIVAGIGRGQLEVLNDRVQKKKDIYALYKESFSDLPIQMMPELNGSHPTHWLSCMTISENSTVTPNEIIKILEENNIESRPIWKPMHMQPIFEGYEFFPHEQDKDISRDIFKYGLCLPSDTKMTIDEQKMIINLVRRCF